MKISAICPVFNEGERVIEVLKVLKKTDFISEAIFVDDGSRDDTFEILKKFSDQKIKVFKLKKNRGKGFALGFGIKKAKGEILIFVDGDLKGLKEEHLKLLVSPLFKKRAKCVIGVPLEKERKFIRPWEIYLSGERAYFKKDLEPILKNFFKFYFSSKRDKVCIFKGLIFSFKV